MTSLVIPVYNRASLISETIDSALNQTSPFKEIIVVNDGSTDNTADVVAQYGSRVKVVSMENQGVQRARNAGVAAAQGNRIAFCDSDDLLDRDYCEVMSQWLNTHDDIDAAYCNFSPFGTRPWFSDRYFSAPSGYFDDAWLDNNFYTNVPDLYIKSVRYPTMWVTGMMIKRGFYDRLNGFNPSFHKVVTEDWEFNLRVISQGSVALCRRPLARIRFHDGNQSGDALRMALGASHVLDYALKNHKGAEQFAAEMREKISEYQVNAFTQAFAQGNFHQLRKIVMSPYFIDESTRTRLKKFIFELPSPLRCCLWRITQFVNRPNTPNR